MSFNFKWQVPQPTRFLTVDLKSDSNKLYLLYLSIYVIISYVLTYDEFSGRIRYFLFLQNDRYSLVFKIGVITK